MSTSTTNSQLRFELPSLSYIDAKWEEPDLCSLPRAGSEVRRSGVAAWFARQLGALFTSRADREAAHELATMSDYQLMDIGLSRSDLDRVFKAEFNEDLRRRGEIVHEHYTR